jgi:hypothetical protein
MNLGWRMFMSEMEEGDVTLVVVEALRSMRSSL